MSIRSCSYKMKYALKKIIKCPHNKSFCADLKAGEILKGRGAFDDLNAAYRVLEVIMHDYNGCGCKCEVVEVE